MSACSAYPGASLLLLALTWPSVFERIVRSDPNDFRWSTLCRVLLRCYEEWEERVCAATKSGWGGGGGCWFRRDPMRCPRGERKTGMRKVPANFQKLPSKFAGVGGEGSKQRDRETERQRETTTRRHNGQTRSDNNLCLHLYIR